MSAKAKKAKANQLKEEFYSRVLSNDGIGVEDQVKFLDNEIANLKLTSNASDLGFSNKKAQNTKLGEEYANKADFEEKARMEFNVKLKQLQKPKPKNLSPLYDAHFDLLEAFSQSQQSVTYGFCSQVMQLSELISVPQHRYLNIQVNFCQLREKKATLINEYNDCRDKINNIESKQSKIDLQCKQMSDFKAFPLEFRSKVMGMFKGDTSKTRKRYSGEYLKNRQLSSKL